MARRDRLAVSFAASTRLSRVRRAALFTLRSRRSRDESEPDDRDRLLPRDSGSSSVRGSDALKTRRSSRRATARPVRPVPGRAAAASGSSAELREGLQGLGAGQQIVDRKSIKFLLQFREAPVWNGHRRGTVSVPTHEARRLSDGHGEVATAPSTPPEVQKSSATDAGSAPHAAERLVGGPRGGLGVALGLPDLAVVVITIS